MEGKPRCKKCGRVLTSPSSIVRGMGPVCAGISGGKGRAARIRVKRSSGKVYQGSENSKQQVPLFPGGLSAKPVSKREFYRRQREERRQAFEIRSRFQCGMSMPKNVPLIYEPLADNAWKEYPSGKVISHERLQHYLTKYRFI